MSILRRLLTRLRFNRAIQTSGTMQMPSPIAQHAVLTEAEKFRQEHGYSQATTPAPWTEDISKHNAAVNQDYQRTIGQMQAQYANGQYSPRFLLSEEMSDTRMGDILAGARPLVDEINWDLEMTLQQGARANVTADVGRPVLAYTQDDLVVARESGNLARQVAALEKQQGIVVSPIRQVIGSRADILAAANGNIFLADQVEQQARELFGVQDLDALPDPVAD